MVLSLVGKLDIVQKHYPVVIILNRKIKHKITNIVHWSILLIGKNTLLIPLHQNNNLSWLGNTFTVSRYILGWLVPWSIKAGEFDCLFIYPPITFLPVNISPLLRSQTRLTCFYVKTNCFILKKLISLVRLKLISSLG